MLAVRVGFIFGYYGNGTFFFKRVHIYPKVIGGHIKNMIGNIPEIFWKKLGKSWKFVCLSQEKCCGKYREQKKYWHAGNSY